MTGLKKKPADVRRAPAARRGHPQEPRLIQNERELIALCLALAGRGASLSAAERAAAKGIAPMADRSMVERARSLIGQGSDPLGGVFLRLRSSEVRRRLGAVYTPAPIVESMLSWCAEQGAPERVIDPGAGSGRYLKAAALRFPRARLIGVELDPVAALMLRANLTVHGCIERATIVVDDFRQAALERIDGRTLFIGNPPYVRHHEIGEAWKHWFAESAHSYGLRASKLAGLHIHFFLRVLQLAQPDDVGAFITSAEWLDVNYGATLRRLLADQLGGVAVHVLDARAMPFENTATTGAITCFKIGHPSQGLRVRAVESMETLNGLSKGEVVPWDSVRKAARWSPLFKPARVVPEGYVELGELCRVHRGQVTGSNDVWIAGEHARRLPGSVLIPTITRARDLLSAGARLDNAQPLRCVVDLPADLDVLDAEARKAVKRFLTWARQQGADQSYIARHRKAWWSVGLKQPAPILSTYMARRAPAFVRNLCDARHINIAHGLYPRQDMPAAKLDALASWLRHNVITEDGRTYAGGLTKFEPKELERVLVPNLDALGA
ncbi:MULTISPECIES: N-6 DNA methylase [unclassified Lysobacter]|uniref:Eco57I restriction-modification methylase domain-containing protein n=1 Tax=unclassified Lysobacter TaxID=2635362 RepID=UPI001BE9CD03|nr:MULTISPECIES: N-6 DNA methylase [unclassified Lysobacter]MBT2749145.1 N-6 DNA methylase [Lysobacter sp. ISL-42]MBT2753261.1 N-6 DNA methylase [Lysobacter sp. ISL-50]MBT2776564.1 N-6 DNA methylase [Lysobacter sp. ISL-54]MBT2783281.1 N-6 DNA methylase [Lysobacter sp. ISL-52]